MTVGKTVATILSNKTAAASGSTTLGDCTVIDTNACVGLAIECKVTYNGSATKGVRVKLFGSYDDVNYDSDPYDYFDMPFTAGSTISCSFNTIPGPRYIKAQVTNLDTGQSATGIYVYSHPMVIS